MISDELAREAKAFDERVLERVRNGLVPDLRNAANVDWFFNNPWRRPEYANMIFGDYLKFALEFVGKKPQNILEIGSGLGHMSLEFARLGHYVTGLELSSESVRIANEHALQQKTSISGTLRYVNDDLMEWHPAEKFDAVCFFLTLHHFQSPLVVLQRVKQFLKPTGTIVVIEPARDLFSKRNASVVMLIRLLLSLNGNWHQPLQLPRTDQQLSELTGDILKEYQEAKDKHEREQSPNDNSSFAKTMIEALDSVFERRKLTYGNTISPRLLGGIRGPSEEETLAVAKFIKGFDEWATANGFLDPGVIYYAGAVK